MQETHARLISLVYVSSAVRVMTTSELLDIVQDAEAFNSAHHITGMLLHKDGSFMQVLEGPESEVLSLMYKISSDPRHAGILELLRKPIVASQFPNWSMGFRDLNTLSNSETRTFGAHLCTSFVDDHFKNEPTAALKLLRFFKENMR